MRTLSNQIATVVLSASLVGCVSTPSVVSYKGAPVTALNSVSMSCSDPYIFTQDCSIWTGASLRVQLNDKLVKVASTTDGRIVIVMTDRLLPTQYEAEQAADAVQAVAAGAGAKLLKLEGLAAGSSVIGYVLHFDRDVYVALREKSGTPGIGTDITTDDNQIHMPHYSMVVPPENRWHLRRPDEINEVAIITMEAGPFVFQIKTMRNTVGDTNKLKTAKANIVADNYRNLEKQIMIKEGVNKGLYQLRDLVMGEEMVGEKKFYTMTYLISASAGTQRASLYLYFPKEDNNDYFIVAHYSETEPSNAVLAKSFKPEFLDILKSLRVNE